MITSLLRFATACTDYPKLAAHFAPMLNDSAARNAGNKILILEALGTFFSYTRGINSTMLTAIGKLASYGTIEGQRGTMKALFSAFEAELGALIHNIKEVCPPANCSGGNGPPAASNTDGHRQQYKWHRHQHGTKEIGYTIASARDNFKFTGTVAKQPVPTMFPNIIRPPIIWPFVPHTCIPLQILRRLF